MIKWWMKWGSPREMEWHKHKNTTKNKWNKTATHSALASLQGGIPKASARNMCQISFAPEGLIAEMTHIPRFSEHVPHQFYPRRAYHWHDPYPYSPLASSFQSTGYRTGRFRTVRESDGAGCIENWTRFPTAWFIGALTRVNHRSPCCQYLSRFPSMQPTLPTPHTYMPLARDPSKKCSIMPAARRANKKRKPRRKQHQQNRAWQDKNKTARTKTKYKWNDMEWMK
jgi:hypothetical protein